MSTTNINSNPPATPSYGSEICSECHWTNGSLINLGESGKPRWVCPGCCKLAIEKLDVFRAVLKFKS